MFESAKLKVERANKHVADLQFSFRSFIEAHPHEFITCSDPQTGAITVETRFRENIPPTFALMIGDAVHNLRTALDHATWELIGRDGGTQDRWLHFPTSRRKEDYISICKRIKTPRSDTTRFFLGFRAYPDGPGKRLFGLNELNSSDKHTVLTPIMGVATVRHLEVKNPDRRTTLTLTNCSFRMGPDGRAHMMSLRPGMVIPPESSGIQK